MKNFGLSQWHSRIPVVLAIFLYAFSIAAQITVEGVVLDRGDRLPVIGAHVEIEGTTEATMTDSAGHFTLQSARELPLILSCSYIGYHKVKKSLDEEARDLVIAMDQASHLMDEVEIVVSRIPESALESPWTAEVLTSVDIQAASSADFYDDIGNMKGVAMHTSSMTFPAVITRGFGKPNNRRFVQLIDGMDNSSPLLNFSVGNVVGISELDLLRAELVPGTASALYGPNAFNGILMMRSKNPFDSEGLSAQIKSGLTSSEQYDSSEPLYHLSMRYAKAIIKNRLAFKVNASYFTATDWMAGDYTTGNISSNTPIPTFPGDPNFNGMNLYGDETPIVVPIVFIAPAICPGLPRELCEAVQNMPTLDLRRTGLREADLLDNRDAKSLKLDGAVHYRFNDDTELSYTYRYGQGSAVYQGGERYALRDFSFRMQKVELAGESLNLRAYITQTDDGDSYNLTALGGFANEAFKPSEQWVGEYAETYIGYLIQEILTKGFYDETDVALANSAGRAVADIGIPDAGTSEFRNTVEAVRSGLFQRDPPGAGFVDDSRLYHIEGTYNFAGVAPGLDLMFGGNFRKYDLFSDGTVFNENLDGEGDNERITNQEFGAFVQLHKNIADDHLRVTGSMRYDKNESFDGQFSPRLAAVLLAGPDKEHAIRASYQTGFRNPSNQEQFIYFPLPTGTLLGGTESNAGRYGVYNGGAYTNESYNAYLATILQGMPDPSLLEMIDIPYVQPEKVQVFEIGYKSIIAKRLYLDFNVYHSRYRDFIAQQTVRLKSATTHQRELLPGVDDDPLNATAFRLYLNSRSKVTSTGAGLGVDYKLPRNFHVYGHYTYTTYDAKDEEPDFDAGFNMPEHIALAGVRNREVVGHLGFDVQYRWQDAFAWENAFGYGTVPAYGTLDANVTYTFDRISTTVKIGGTNLLGKDYRNIIGGPSVGRTVFAAITYGLN